MSQIIVTRKSGGYTDRLRRYRVLVDGNEVGRVGAGESVTADVTAGSHTIQLKVDWATSPSVAVDIAADETRELYCEPGANAFTVLYYSTFARNRYIKLRPA